MNEKTVYLVIYDGENNYETFMYDDKENAFANTYKILTEQGYELTDSNHYSNTRSFYHFVHKEIKEKILTAILETITIRNYQNNFHYVTSIMETIEEPFYSIEIYANRKFAHNKVRKLFIMFLSKYLDKIADKELRELIRDFANKRSEGFYIPQISFAPSVVLRACKKQFKD